MSSFQTYLKLGFTHISDLNGYDHILFLIALCAVYLVSQWRTILILVTAFTIGHSLSLALATLTNLNLSKEIIIGSLHFPISQFVEFLIPVTILLTAIFNVARKKTELNPKEKRTQYLITMGFGLIHGLGFSNYLKAIRGSEDSLFQPLLAFNLGLEIGQIMIVTIIMAIAFVVLNLRKTPHRDWNLFVSGAAAGIAIILMIETKFW